jgi:serine/threonine protein kinase
LTSFEVQVFFFAEKNETWKWEKVSKTYEEKFEKLIEHGRKCPDDILEINGVRVCLKEEFLVGSGGQSNGVYVGLGRDGSEKAVKLFFKATHARLAEKEEELLRKCKTKEFAHVVKYWYFDDTTHKQFAFLIMELCEETLKNFVARNSLDDLIKVAPDIIQQILRGLADLHREPDCILHRDVKPLNIFRNANGKWLLADFGIGRILPNDETTLVTMEGGTKKWQAVESCLQDCTSDDGKVRYKTKSDIQV